MKSKEEMMQGWKERFLKTEKEIASKLKEKAEKNQGATDLLLISSAVHILSSVHLWKKGGSKLCKAAGALSLLMGSVELLSKLGVGMAAMNAIANAIDRSIEKKENAQPVAEDEVAEFSFETEEDPVEEFSIETVEEETEEISTPVVENKEPENEIFAPVVEKTAEPVEEPVVETMVEIGEDAVEDVADEDSDDGEDDEEKKDNSNLFAGVQMKFIDVKDKPEIYAEFLDREAKGEVQLVTRYKTGFRARVIQSQGNVQHYYSAIKNALLSYKGVKGRISWNFDSYHCGRDNIAKINVKNKTIYLYLALDPSKMADSKYGLTDMSGKKKFDDVQMLLKIRGERKFKYALELIQTICTENLNLKPLEDAKEIDYTEPYRDTETLVEMGEVKKMVAAVAV